MEPDVRKQLRMRYKAHTLSRQTVWI